jgi:hypothetical protein
MEWREHPLWGLRWTTRGDVCAALLQYMQRMAAEETSLDLHSELRPQSGEVDTFSVLVPTEYRVHPRAAQLFALLAQKEHIPVLRRLHLEPGADWQTRQNFRDALVRLQAQVPAGELKALLEWEHEGLGRCNFGLFEGLFRTPEAQNAAREVMEGWTAAERAWSLTRMSWYASLRPLADWLYERWLNEDRRLLEDVEDFEGSLNWTVARYTAKSMKRPEAKAILLEYWRQAEGEARKELRDYLWDFDDGVPAAWVADRSEELRELAESFSLTHADLVSYHGSERLLESAVERLRLISRQLQADPRDKSPLDAGDFKRTVWMLADWPEPGVRERIRSLCACPDIDTEVRWEFCDYLWDRRHEEMNALVLAAGQMAGDLLLVQRVVRWLADTPASADRELLWWAAFRDEDWQLPYWGMQGLEQLGEMSEAWYERLRELSRSSQPFLWLQANGALARRGEREKSAEVARMAVESDDPCVRGEAIRVLGQLGAVEHLDTIRQALWAEDSVYKVEGDAFIPVAEEAALALGRIGTPAALTALIQGFLFLPEHPPAAWVQAAAGRALEVLVARMEGQSLSFDTMPMSGWRWWWFRPWPEPSFRLSD